jgi:hypothetical protein
LSHQVLKLRNLLGSPCFRIICAKAIKRNPMRENERAESNPGSPLLLKTWYGLGRLTY